MLTEVVALAMATQLAVCPLVTPDEMAEAHRWIAAKFEGVVRPLEPTPGLLVLANNDPVQRNGRGGEPMHLSGREYRRGLYCHAVSKVVVRLPGPGRTFHALAGVDTNDQTSGGRGSVVFSVSVGGRQAFKTGVMHEGTPPVPVTVDLGGATEFVLEVGDAGDGISCDQSDWAEARVELEDGKTVWLGDMPITDNAPRPYDTSLPFSFVYGGKPLTELVGSWRIERSSEPLDEQRIARRIVCTDPATGLIVRAEGTEYLDFPTVEWTIYLKNAGNADTPILSDLQALDTVLYRGGVGPHILHHAVGSPCQPNDYQPLKTELGPGAEKVITTSGGRPTNSDLPYFNVEWFGRGVIAVIGWPGQWAARFTRDAEDGLRLRGGQEQTHFTLRPGEQVRGPRIVLQFWSGDRIHAQNVWRRWMVAHNMPRPGGKTPEPLHVACSSHWYGEMIHANTANQEMFIDRYVEEKLKLDYWWMDAGWYVNDGTWPNTGTWKVDQKRFPGGLRPISDHARAKGIKTIVWFEPERVTPHTELYDEHQNWILGGTLLNLGNPEARAWLTERIDGLLKSEGIDLYRQDFNMDPLAYWRANDAPDRQGITEIRHVEGYLAYWDELLRRHPGMLIDTCASGGRRNDIETLRRAVPLLRSDYIMEPVANQCHTYGMSFWIPYQGTGTSRTSEYEIRSVLCASFNSCWDMRRKDLDYALFRRLMAERKEIAPLFLGDYYPLTGYSLENDVWIAWQYDRPEDGRGVVQAFRRSESPYEALRVKLHGLSPDAKYRVRELGRRRPAVVVSGAELAEKGLRIEIHEQPGTAFITYTRLNAQ